MIQVELRPEIEARLVAEAHAEGVEPSLFFAHAPDSVERFVALILDYHIDGGL